MEKRKLTSEILSKRKDRARKVNRLRGFTTAIGCGTMALLHKC